MPQDGASAIDQNSTEISCVGAVEGQNVSGGDCVGAVAAGAAAQSSLGGRAQGRRLSGT